MPTNLEKLETKLVWINSEIEKWQDKMRDPAASREQLIAFNNCACWFLTERSQLYNKVWKARKRELKKQQQTGD